MISTFRVKYEKPVEPKDESWSADLDELSVDISADNSSSSDQPTVSLSSLESQSVSVRDPLERKKDKISVTDMSAQMWCEVQLEFALATGYKRTTAAMVEGNKRHEELEAADHPVEEVAVETAEDDLGVRLLSSYIGLSQFLWANTKVREVWTVIDLFPRGLMRGVIDELALSADCQRLIIRDTKTRRDETLPSAAQKRTSFMQLQMYRLMLERLRLREGETLAVEDCVLRPLNWPQIFKGYKVDSQKSFEHPILQPYNNLHSLASLFQVALYNLPPLAECVEVEYDFQGKTFYIDRIKTTVPMAQFSFEGALEWWLKRRASTVPLQRDKWKCKHCPFLKICDQTPLRDSEKEEALTTQSQAELEADLEDLAVSPVKMTDNGATTKVDQDQQKDGKSLPPEPVTSPDGWSPSLQRRRSGSTRKSSQDPDADVSWRAVKSPPKLTKDTNIGGRRRHVPKNTPLKGVFSPIRMSPVHKKARTNRGPPQATGQATGQGTGQASGQASREV